MEENKAKQTSNRVVKSKRQVFYNRKNHFTVAIRCEL